MTGHAQHASLATEASLLLTVVADRLEPIVQAGRDQAADPDPAPTEPAAEQAAEHQPCTSCPICVLITVVKSDNGEINHKLAEGALLMVNALRGMLTDSATKPQSPPANPVQHIDIG